MIPVALCIYRRPEQTARVFDAIRAYKPNRLFVIADGPKDGEEAAVQAARDAIQVDWDCLWLPIYSSENRGSGVTESRGITEVFRRVDRCIFLEDDCLPDPTFWQWCEEMLDRYEDDPRVMCVSGNNFHPDPRTHDSYWFSRYVHLWGWATWKRAWQHYDFRPNWITNHSRDPAIAAYFRNILNGIHAGAIDAYDYQWMFAMWEACGVCITPSTHMVHNIGFGADATNMTHAGVHPNPPSAPMKFPLRHPAKVEVHEWADIWEEWNLYLPMQARRNLAAMIASPPMQVIK